MTADLYYYRGTTEGWPGNACLQGERITCATTDPIVATLFAIECRNRGRSLIQMVRMQNLESREAPWNFKALVESAVNLSVAPSDFASQACRSIEVDRSVEILAVLGHRWLPVRLAGLAALGQILDDLHHAGLRLSLNQIELFNQLAEEEP